MSRGKRSNGIVEYNFVQQGQQCSCKCCGGPVDPVEPALRWQLLFMIDSSACVDKYLSFGKLGSLLSNLTSTNLVRTKVEGVVAELSQFQSQHRSSLNIELSFAVFSDEVKYVTQTHVVTFDASNAEQ